MKTIEATFRIVTPMFLGGADQKAVDIRPPAIKGALRFWWRALNWSQTLKQADGDEAAALRALHDREAGLFGISAGVKTEGGKPDGQGIFLLNVVHSRSDKIEPAEQPFKNMTSAQLYLLGMGLGTFKDGNHVTRNALASGHFSVRLLFRPQVGAQDQQSIADALYAFGLLGSLGSRARHGMGSVTLTDWKGDAREVPQDRSAYRKALLGLVQNQDAGEPPFTAFSRLSRVDFSARDSDPLRLLTTVGSEQQMYRSYGQKGMVGNKPSERNFTADHDLALAFTEGAQPKDAPKRVIFGLPHNYFFSSTKGKVDLNHVSHGKDSRRASPLMLHIHALGEKDFVAVHTLMPARFLPPGTGIHVKPRGRAFDIPAKVDWQVLRTYLERFKEGETIHGQ